MDWSRAVNSYCERLDASFWSEPVNALSNVGFLLVAALVWRRPEVRSDPGARLLTLVLVAIGVGSFLFHTHAEVWAMLADVLPILGFILIYVHLATVRFLGAPVWGGALAAVAYVPASAMASRGITSAVGPVNGSVSYMPVAILIAAYALALARRKPQTARGLAIGAAALCLSIALRSVDQAVCPAFPLGTHFFWHLLNAALLGWMILVLARHRTRPRTGVAGPPGGGFPRGQSDTQPDGTIW